MVLRACLMLRTLNLTSNEVVNAIRQHFKQHILAGSIVYGWYDIFIELDIPSKNTLITIVQELLHYHLNVTHIETTIERISNHPLRTPLLAS